MEQLALFDLAIAAASDVGAERLARAVAQRAAADAAGMAHISTVLAPLVRRLAIQRAGQLHFDLASA